MIQVIEGNIIKYNLPKVGTLKDGSTVSGYHLLDEETLLEEGWLPLEDIQPEYNIVTQYLIDDGYEILEDKVIKKYRVEDIKVFEPVEVEPSKIDLLKEKVEALEEENFNLMMATTELYEEQYTENLNLMMAITELYEMNMEVN